MPWYNPLSWFRQNRQKKLPTVDVEAKPVSLNPSNKEQVARHIQRIHRLKMALNKPGLTTERVMSLQRELDRRQAALLAAGIKERY